MINTNYTFNGIYIKIINIENQFDNIEFDLPFVKNYINENKERINEKNQAGYSALMLLYGTPNILRYEIAKFLLEQENIDVNQYNNYDDTLLM